MCCGFIVFGASLWCAVLNLKEAVFPKWLSLHLKSYTRFMKVLYFTNKDCPFFMPCLISVCAFKNSGISTFITVLV